MSLARRTRSQSEEIAALRQEIRDLRRVISESSNHEELVDHLDEADMSLPGLTWDEAQHVSIEDYIANPEPYDRVIAAGPDGGLPGGLPGEPPAAQRLATGQQLRSEHAGPERAPLSIDSIRRMPLSEVEARKSEIDEFLSRGGR